MIDTKVHLHIEGSLDKIIDSIIKNKDFHPSITFSYRIMIGL